MNVHEIIQYDYKFVLNSQVIIEIPILLDAKTLALVYSRPEMLPDWTRLECHQCPNCPLQRENNGHCPIAVSISDLIYFFSDVSSYQKLEVYVKSPYRTYMELTTVQKGLSSILGIFMVTSGCPVLDKLRPMARFHLPFSSYEETSYRALSMYLVIQYLRHKKGKQADWDLQGLSKIYQDIQQVNRAFNRRLKSISDKDANTNALVLLDCFASMITTNTELEQLLPEQLKDNFQPFLD